MSKPTRSHLRDEVTLSGIHQFDEKRHRAENLPKFLFRKYFYIHKEIEKLCIEKSKEVGKLCLGEAREHLHTLRIHFFHNK